MTIGERIKQRRVELEWSQRELAKRMKYSNHTTITKIEAGQVDISQSRIKQFSEVLGVSIAYLMGWEEEPSEETKKDNGEIASLVVRMRMDKDFLNAVKALDNISAEKLQSLTAFLENFQH